MPGTAPSRCTEPGCTTLTAGRRCPDHAHHAAGRGRSAIRPNDRAYRVLCAQVLRDELDCRHCGNPATEVDHIRPLWAGGARLARGNLQALCHDCHTAKTAREATARARARRAAQRAPRDPDDVSDDQLDNWLAGQHKTTR